MRDIKAGIKKGLSWILTAALTMGFVSAAGVTAGADTVTPSEKGRNLTATVSDAGLVKKETEEEPLDEEGYLLDGEIVGDMAWNMAEEEPATASNAKREKYPILYPYFPNDSPEHLEFRILGENLVIKDEVKYSFISKKEDDEIAKNQKTYAQELRSILTRQDRVCFYDFENAPFISIPDYFKEREMEDTPGDFYFWVENPDDEKIRDIYAPENKGLRSLTYECILPRVIASFEDGAEAWSGSVEKGTKIFLSTDKTRYDSNEYWIQYTLDGTFPGTFKNTGIAPKSLFAEKVTVYKPEKPIVINEDTVLRAVAYPVKDGEIMDVPDGYADWIVGTWNFTVLSDKEDHYEKNDSLKDRFPLDFPTQISALISVKEDRDFYSFSNGGYGSVRLTLTPAPYCAYGLRLMTETGEVLKECVLKPEKAGVMGESQTIVYSGADGKGLPKDGKFAVEVWSLNETFDENRPYTLRIVPTVYASAGELAADPDFSELDMALARFGLEGGEQTDYTGSNGRKIQGGMFGNALNYLSQWYGPVDESLAPYPDTTKIDEKDLPASYAYRDHSSSAKYHLQNMILGLGPNAGREEYINSIKNMVYTYGGCEIAYLHTDASESEEFTKDGITYKEGSFLYDNRTEDGLGTDGSHSVEVVGWDDNLPKELFSHSVGTEKGKNNFGTPKKDGGFLIKNSWGKDSSIDGFLWISYESTSLMDCVSSTGDGPTAFLMEKAGQYDRQYLNDATGCTNFCATETSNRILYYGKGSVEAGNIFTADDNDQLLTAVSLMLMDPGVNYDVWLTYNGKTQKILSGCEQYAGYYTKQLSDPVLIKAGTDFTLTEVLYADGGADVGFPYGDGEKMEGRAFRIDRNNGVIIDMSKEGSYPCIRAFTVIPDYSGKPKRICSTTYNKEYGQTVNRDTGFAYSEYAAEAIEGNSLENTLVSSAASDSITVSDLPASYDARKEGLVTTVKNQGKYGTCWSFGTIAAVETNVLLNGGTRMEYARDINFSSPETKVYLTKKAPTCVVKGTATINAKNPYDGSIFFTYTGDTDSIEVLTTCEVSGTEAELFRFKKPGTVQVCATCGADAGLHAELEFTATVQEIESFELPQDSYELKVGEELQLEPKIYPEDVWDDTILYTSSDPTIAYVDNNGKITALKAGTVTIRLEGGDQFLEIKVTVTGSRGHNGGSGSGSSGGSSAGSRQTGAGPAETPGSWQMTAAGWIFVGNDGNAVKDRWIFKGSKWYYMDTAGIMKTGWLLDRGLWYYLDPVNGDMKTGLITESGYQYYLSPADGHMLTGTIQVPGFAEPLRFNETLPPAPTYTLDPLSGIWKKNEVDALPYGARTK